MKKSKVTIENEIIKKRLTDKEWELIENTVKAFFYSNVQWISEHDTDYDLNLATKLVEEFMSFDFINFFENSDSIKEWPNLNFDSDPNENDHVAVWVPLYLKDNLWKVGSDKVADKKLFITISEKDNFCEINEF